MIKQKNTKKALLASVLSMILCMAMLIGSTFAWFTDSVTSGKNKIVAGNLDVELYAKDGDEYTPVMPDSNLFLKDTLWEPGHVEVINLKVANIGTLSLQYRLGINVVSEKEGVSVQTNETFKLSDYIMFALIDGDQDFGTDDAGRAAAIATAEANAVKLSELAADENGVLYPEGTEGKDFERFVTLVVYMPTTVGNEANYKTETEAPEIDLGIKLVATQTPFEKDSFGDDYDKNAEYPVIESNDEWYTSASNGNYTIKNGNELAYLAELVNAGTDDFKGKTITLANNIVLPVGDWKAIGTYQKPFKGTFDGANYTVSNVVIHDNDGGRVGGFFGAIDGAIIKNLKVSGSMTLGGKQEPNLDAYAGNGGICAYANKSTISNCTNGIDIDASGRVAETSVILGGIVAFAENTNVSACHNEGNIIVPKDAIAAGIVPFVGKGGFGGGIMVIIDKDSCSNNGEIILAAGVTADDVLIGELYCMDYDE